MGRLRLLDQRQPRERASQTLGHRRGIKRRKLQLRQDRVDQVYAPDELFQIVVEQRELEPALAICLGQTTTRGDRIDLPLMLVMNHKFTEAFEFDRGDAFV